MHFYGSGCGQPRASTVETAQEWELFDRINDPQEMHSVYGDPRYAEVQAELTAALDRLAVECGDSNPT